jgi:sulfonate transport system permease protein
MKAIRARLAGLIVVVLLVAVWQAAADAKLVSPVYLPGPDRAWAALVNGLAKRDLGAKLLGTIGHMIEGWLVASIVGVALGALIGASATARAFIGPTLEFLRPLPASAVIPVAIAIFGLSPAMALGVIAFGAIWPMLLATVHGFAAVEPRLYEVAKVMRLSRASVILKIALPSALPDILAGLRLGLTVALILAVVCEMIAGLNGLGNWVLLAARMFRSADLFAGVILLGAVGLAGALALNLAERRLLAWRAPQSTE